MLRQKHLTRGATVEHEGNDWTVVAIQLNTVQIERDGITKYVTVHTLKLKDDGNN